LSEFLADAVARFPRRIALSDGARRVSYSELGDLAARLASALGAAGVRRGDRVALMLPNSIEYIASFFGVACAGAVVTQMNPLYVRPEVEHILADSSASALFIHAEAYERLEGMRAPATLRTVIVVGSTARPVAAEAVPFSAFVEGAPHPGTVALDPSRDLAVIQYTGATTGRARGAAHTHASLLAAVGPTISVLIEDVEAFPPDAKALAVAPLFHIFGTTMVLLFGFELGWNLVLVPRFDAEEILTLIRKERPVMVAGVATIFAAFNARSDLERYELDRVKLFVSGGASVPPALAREFEARTGRPIWEGYGLSEAAPVAFNSYLNGPRPGSVGVPVPGTDVRIVDAETGSSELPAGAAGELLVRGPQLMREYWQRPDETSAALAGGWLHTGDVARISADGFVELVDRKKEMINTSGYKVYPRELEDALYQHPAVAEALVIGIADDARGEIVKAFITLKSGAAADTESIIDHCRTLLAPYKIPREVEYRTSLPKSAVGKLLRRVLVEEEQAGHR
jgi:long-chain acyl-CoA synthetase